LAHAVAPWSLKAHAVSGLDRWLVRPQ